MIAGLNGPHYTDNQQLAYYLSLLRLVALVRPLPLPLLPPLPPLPSLPPCLQCGFRSSPFCCRPWLRQLHVPHAT